MTPFTSQELRKGFASFATGVTVITCVDEELNPHGITISSFNTVSLEPPLILWSLKKHSRLMPWVEVGRKHLIHVPFACLLHAPRFYAVPAFPSMASDFPGRLEIKRAPGGAPSNPAMQRVHESS